MFEYLPLTDEQIPGQGKKCVTYSKLVGFMDKDLNKMYHVFTGTCVHTYIQQLICTYDHTYMLSFIHVQSLTVGLKMIIWMSASSYNMQK